VWFRFGQSQGFFDGVVGVVVVFWHLGGRSGGRGLSNVVRALGVVIRRLIVDMVSLQEEVFVDELHYGLEEAVVVVERKMRGFEDEWWE
jgi:hypothetical protein